MLHKKDTVAALHGIYCSNKRFPQFTLHRSGRKIESGLVSGGNKETTMTGTMGRGVILQDLGTNVARSMGQTHVGQASMSSATTRSGQERIVVGNKVLYSTKEK